MAIKTYKKGSSERLSENFRAREFDCPGKGCCKQTPVDSKLVEYLQNIRTHFGKPIIVLGYRCAAYNAKTPNASPTSKHTKGMAADFHIDGVAPAEIAKYAESIGVKGIGLYDDFVHIDTRTSKSFWYGHAQAYRSTFGGSPAKKKTVDELAREVIAGKWGVGEDRRQRLLNAGYDPAAVQAKVNELLTGKSSAAKKSNSTKKPAASKKTVDELAREVIAGKWGVGEDRRQRLLNAGYDPAAVQAKVNQLLPRK